MRKKREYNIEENSEKNIKNLANKNDKFLQGINSDIEKNKDNNIENNSLKKELFLNEKAVISEQKINIENKIRIGFIK